MTADDGRGGLAAALVYVVDFEPGLFGPFPSREAADGWASAYLQGDGSWTTRILRDRAAAPRAEAIAAHNDRQETA